MSDLVNQLREDAEHVMNHPDYVGSPDYSAGLMEKSAACIERLDAALNEIACHSRDNPLWWQDHTRAALQETKS